MTLIDVGSFYGNHGKPDQALQYYTDALQVERQLGDQTNQALCLNNIGSIKVDQGQYQDALTYLEQAYDLRQKLNAPGDVADSQHNLAEVNTKLGQYDTALQFYLKALDGYRGLNDPVGVAQQAEGMARIFAAQGRYGAALGSMKNAVDSIRQTKEMTSFTVEIVGGWGDLLTQAGRGAEGKASLDEALSDAVKIKDQPSLAMATNWLGDFYFFQGDYTHAREQYSLALGIASKTPDKETQLQSKVNLAKTDLALGHSAAVAPVAKKLASDADALGLKAVSVECSVVLAQALVATKNAGVSEVLTLTLARAENLGLKVLEAKAQYLQATLDAKSGKSADAARSYRAVVGILDGIGKEEGAGKVLQRADLAGIYSDAGKNSK
jgi:tetratricopeptide (TPR) repeat protein